MACAGSGFVVRTTGREHRARTIDRSRLTGAAQGQSSRVITTTQHKNSQKIEPACKPGSVVNSHSSRACVAAHLKRPTREQRGPRLMLPYLVLLRVGFALPPALPQARCALTAPFHPYRRRCRLGGIFSVALSVGSRLPGVTWHFALWSPDFPLCPKAQRLSGRLMASLTRDGHRSAA